MKRSGLTRKPKQRNRRKRQPLDVSLPSRFWHDEVTRDGCAMCRAFPVDRDTRVQRHAELRHIEGHHVLAKRHLKAHRLEHMLWDTRNGMGLCEYHHQRHENHVQRVPRSLLEPRHLEFAVDVALDWLLDHDYPTTEEGT